MNVKRTMESAKIWTTKDVVYVLDFWAWVLKRYKGVDKDIPKDFTKEYIMAQWKEWVVRHQ